MSDNLKQVSMSTEQLGSDFRKFWVGQTISNLGTSFTLFALPLLVFKLTGSALNLGLSTAANYIAYLLFGLIIGAWVDRVNRKRLMIATDLTRALVIASIPLLSVLGILSVWWIYLVGFISTTLAICFDSSEFAAIPSLINKDNLVTANGQIQASYSAATVIGPLLAGVLVVTVPVPMLMLVDALSFLISACSLLLIKASFNTKTSEKREPTSLRSDMIEGLRYVLRHPVLRNIAIMMAFVNFLNATTFYQIILFVKVHFRASDAQVALFYSAGGIGIVVLALLAGRLRKYLSFGVVALGTLMVSGLLIIAMTLIPWYWAALLLWACIWGLNNLFNINTNSFRQVIVPNHMLGRVRSIASVLAWSAVPLGSLAGGIVLEKVKDVALVYGIIGALIFLIALIFSFTALSHAERYLPKKE